MAIPGVRVGSPRRLMTGSAMSPSQSARVRVETNLTEFNRKLKEFAKQFEGDVGRLVLAHALDYQARVQRRTPVDTGRLRNSIHTIPPGTKGEAFQYRDNQGRSFNGSLENAVTGKHEVIVGTNVEYATVIEAGHSKQAPAGMFAVTLKEKTGALEQALQKALLGRWGQTKK